MSGHDGFYCQGAHNDPCGAADCYVTNELRREIARLKERVDQLLRDRATVLEEEKTVRDVLRAEHQACQNFRAALLRACDAAEDMRDPKTDAELEVAYSEIAALREIGSKP